MKDKIRAHALALGFDVVGFAPAHLAERNAQRLDEMLALGQHGDMDWLETRKEQRVQPKVLWEGVQSVIMLGQNYGPAFDPLDVLRHPDRGGISVYAKNRDYHDLIKRRLKALARFMVDQYGGELKVFVDTAPVMEKPLAALSGIGWQARHSNIVSREFGSWLFLGAIYSTLPLDPDPPEKDHCGSCTRCQTACPTGAITDFAKVDPSLCVSYLTIEHKGEIAPALRPLLGNRIYGCDDCLAVCPWNKYSQPTTTLDFLPRVELQYPRLVDLAELDDATFREVFTASPIKRIGRDRFLRNVCIAMGNAIRGQEPKDPNFVQKLGSLSLDQSPLVAEAARWALDQG